TVAWFHCFAGIAGDMALGACLDAGAPLDEVVAILERLPISGWELEAELVLRGGLAGTKAHVKAKSDTITRTYGHIAGVIEEAPVVGLDVNTGLTTPTGAALLAGLCSGYGPLPPMRLATSGFGAGTRELATLPNLVQVAIGEAPPGTATAFAGEPLALLEANLDDISGEVV